MTAEAESVTKGPPRLVGQVYAEIRIRNAEDVVVAERGFGASEEIRVLMLDRVLVDTGATHLCLPARMIDELGLRTRKEIVLLTASGQSPARLVGPAEIEIEGRTTTVDIIELPAGEQPLLGMVLMGALGLEPDLRHERLRLLPETGPQSYFTAY